MDGKQALLSLFQAGIAPPMYHRQQSLAPITFMPVSHVAVGHATADENVGADHRAATSKV
jgi:hypothetical protein